MSNGVSKQAFWAGWILTVLPSAMLIFSAVGKFMKGDDLEKGFESLGWGLHLALPLGLVELGCTLIYLFPRTAILGAVLLTGYFGGAIATHVRVGDPFFLQFIFGMILWFALFLREPRLRVLLPLRG